MIAGGQVGPVSKTSRYLGLEAGINSGNKRGHFTAFVLLLMSLMDNVRIITARQGGSGISLYLAVIALL